MEFIPYRSIPNLTSYHKEKLEGMAEAQTSWLIMEKIHGANLGVYLQFNTGKEELSDMLNFKFASCSGFIEDGQYFYGHTEAINDTYKFMLGAFYGMTLSLMSTLKLKTVPYGIYTGELFGGKIQKGVAYGESKQFNVFDYCLVFDAEDYEVNESKIKELNYFINPEYVNDNKKVVLYFRDKFEMLDIMVSSGIPVVPFKMVTTLAELLEESNDFESLLVDQKYVNKISSHTDADVLAIRKKAEGFVCEPVSSFVYSGSRAMFKSKSRFMEEKAIDENKVPFKVRVVSQMSDEQANIFEKFLELITEERYENIVVKEGRPYIMIEDICSYAGKVLNDAKEELLRDEGIDLSKHFNKGMLKDVIRLSNNYAINIIKPLILT